MAIRRVSKEFKDISLSFEPHPVTKDLPILKNERAISRAVRNLVETRFTERFFNPNIGSKVNDSLFEFVDYGSAVEIQLQIRLLIEENEPRVDNVRVAVRPRPDRNEFECIIYYNIVGSAIPEQEFNFILEATR
jgi:phage baseplate assembly protein W